jgi:hypothetical protein
MSSSDVELAIFLDQPAQAFDVILARRLEEGHAVDHNLADVLLG